LIRDERRRAKPGLSLAVTGVAGASPFRFGRVPTLDLSGELTAALGTTELGAAAELGTAAFTAGRAAAVEAFETTAFSVFATAAGAIC
jgi:hypothetical protein